MRFFPAFLALGLLEACSIGGPDPELPVDFSRGASEPAASFAQTPPIDWSAGLDLEQALSLALSKNPRLAVSRGEVDVAHAQRVTAGTFVYNPELALEGNRAVPFSESGDYAVRLGLSQTFETGGQRSRRLAAAGANFERARSSTSDAERSLRGQVTLAFYETLFLQRQGEIAAQNAEIARRLLETAEARRRAGQIPELEVNLVRLESRKAQVEVDRSVRELARSRTRLAAWLGEPGRKDIQAKGDLAVALVMADGSKLTQIALERRPDLAALKATERMFLERARLAEASAWPDTRVGIFGERNVLRFPLGGGAQGADRDNLAGVELSFALPLWNVRRGERLEAEAEKRRTAMEIDALSQEIRRDVELGVERLALARSTLELYEKQLNALSKQNLDDVERAYKAGEVGTLELLRAQENFNRTNLSYLEAQLELRVAIAELEAAAGARLSEIK